MLRQLSDELGLKMQGVKGISCECGEACVGQTGHHCVKTARTWPTQYSHLPDRLVLAEHGIAISHQVILQGIRGGY